MRAHYLQHVPFEGLGSIEQWLKPAGYNITGTKFFESADLPDLRPIDLLIVMGGPMSVNDVDTFNWITQEKQFIRDAIQSETPILGICLGAQLIASALGSAVYQNTRKEIGWYPIQGIPPTSESSFRFPLSTTVFHWHGETFDLPSGATLLAKSEACNNQAFQFGKSTMGLQFHLETTPEAAKQIVSNCRAELNQLPNIQTEAEILSAKPELYIQNNEMMDRILSYITKNGSSTE